MRHPSEVACILRMIQVMPLLSEGQDLVWVDGSEASPPFIIVRTPVEGAVNILGGTFYISSAWMLEEIW